jgi:ferrous-iron efflux pump FieF
MGCCIRAALNKRNDAPPGDPVWSEGESSVLPGISLRTPWRTFRQTKNVDVRPRTSRLRRLLPNEKARFHPKACYIIKSHGFARRDVNCLAGDVWWSTGRTLETVERLESNMEAGAVFNQRLREREIKPMSASLSDGALRRMASIVALVVALSLVVVKVWAWLATGSISLLTSAADGLVDVVASSVTFAGVRYAAQPVDREHRYGHGKAEAVAAFVQALLLAGAAVGLGIEAARRLVVPQSLNQTGFGIWVIVGSSLAAAALVGMQTIVVKRTGSTAIAADRAHYVTDVAVNIAVLIALLLEHYLDWGRADATGALAISLYMLWNARGMAAEALVQLLDRELDTDERARIETAVRACDGVQSVHDIRTRNGGDRVFVEFHVEVDGSLTVAEGHEIGDLAEKSVQRLFASADVTAHLEPAGIDDARLDDLVK